MITPEYLNEIIRDTELAVARLNTQILVDIVKRISSAFNQGGQLLMPSTIHDMYKIIQSGYDVSDIEKIIQKAMPNISNEIHKAFLSSANEIAKYNDEFARLLIQEENMNIHLPKYTFENIPKSAEDLHMTRSEIMKLENAYKRTNHTVQNMTKTTALRAYRDYIQACDDAYMKVQAGYSPARAIQESVEELAKRGCTTVQYPSGHVDKADVAIARAVRTGINQANSEIILTRCAEMGIKYVKVSQHLGARTAKVDDYTNHAWWQGKIYSLDWNNPILAEHVASVPIDDEEFGFLEKIKRFLTRKRKQQYPDFVSTCGYGTIEGIIGINCRHTFQMWLPEVNIDTNEPIDPAENARREKAEQKARAMERQMRDVRRQIEVVKNISPQNDDTKDKVRKLKKKLMDMGTKYKEFCDSNNLPYHYENTR